MPDSLCRHARLAAGVFLAALLGGCAALLPQTEALRQARPSALPERVDLATVPFFPQQDYQCGPAALATEMAAFKVPVTPEDLVPKVYLPARRGSLQVEMLAAPRRYGLVSYQLAPRFEDVLREVAAGNPVIVLQNYGVWPIDIWHYAVVVGFDFPAGRLALRSGEKEHLTMPFGVLEYTWKDSDYWSMVAMPPGRIPVTADEARYLEAVVAMERVAPPAAARTAYAALVQRWPDSLGGAIGLANAEYAMHDLKAAERVLRDAGRRHPESAAVLNNLAQVLSDEGNNQEALRLIDRARELGGPLAADVADTRRMILGRMAPAGEAAKP